MTHLVSAHEVVSLAPALAVEAVRAAVAGDLDPDATPPRTVLDLEHGQALLMPAEFGGWFGVKVATVAPGNPRRGLHRINGSYVLHDSATLRPVALLDAVALTMVRTPAVSLAACLPRLVALGDRVTGPGVRVVVFGSGPQAQGHVVALGAYLRIAQLTVVTCSGVPVQGAAFEAAQWLSIEQPRVADVVAAADVVVLATTAREPVFDGALVRPDATVLAVGSHEPSARELDGQLMGRSLVVVESREVARREAGDVVLAVAEGHLDPGGVWPFASVWGPGADPSVVASVTDPGRPLVVKTCGMAWEDLVVAVALVDRFGVTS